ncbi:hypothetical protein M2103_001718 [Ereboglobus sp. PH5-5]|uniref:SIR2 family protein n=1 Tax=Ereboglobus sp. PH5-5 TaxID=2940529 RepID=UPI002406BDA1|nr:SIR2 family protein [Ereboglobus sp. PH5-5]MDF9833491.1 hypothetical protein [Ereboglobus sp. PH5-5]
MSSEAQLAQILSNHNRSPFLFIGSGFSRRYLRTPSWDDLLRQFSAKLPQPYEFYYSQADSKLPLCASLIAKDYADFWWKDPSCEKMREGYKNEIISSSSPLKIAISDMLRTQTRIAKDQQLVDELQGFRSLNVEGIITTNWDNLLEYLFSDYKIYIGQQSIVTQTPQNIGEIYKIHGCCSCPNSLVLTDDDYKKFKDRQAYLAAKLITIFVEHPVIFLGYSVSDPNIIDLLKSILLGLGSDEISKIQKNLIFVQRVKEGRDPSISKTILVVEETHLPITHIVSDNFELLYSSISQTKLKLPAQVLRFCKSQIYEIVTSKEPSERLCLLDIDEIKNKKNVEFVVGLGVVKNQLGDRGYRGISLRDIFEYVLGKKKNLDPEKTLRQAIPALDNGKNYIPVFHLLKDANMSDRIPSFEQPIQRLAAATRDSFKTMIYQKAALRELHGKSFKEILETFSPEKIAMYVPHLNDERIDLIKLAEFLSENIGKAFDDKYSTYYRKLFCLYDYLTGR